MSYLTSGVIEDTVLLTFVLIDATLLALFLFVGLKNCSPAARSYIFAFLVFAVFLFLFFQDQLYSISEPTIETFQAAQQRYS